MPLISVIFIGYDIRRDINPNGWRNKGRNPIQNPNSAVLENNDLIQKYY